MRNFDLNRSGQTLVEVALVLPLLGVGIFMVVQLILYGHNMIELQRMAMVMADRVSVENYKDSGAYTRLQSMIGDYTWPRLQYTRQNLSNWRAANGLSTIKSPGQLISVRVSSTLLPGSGFSDVFPAVKQEATAQTIFDPPLPADE